jgi:hypothetical protein
LSSDARRHVRFVRSRIEHHVSEMILRMELDYDAQ